MKIIDIVQNAAWGVMFCLIAFNIYVTVQRIQSQERLLGAVTIMNKMLEKRLAD
jgi:hypothetical protein